MVTRLHAFTNGIYFALPGVLEIMSSPAKSNVVRFGIYEFEPHAKELRRGGLRVHLDGQPIAILKMLLDRPGELVTREELQKDLWPEDIFVDFEHSLNAAVKRLRAAFNDSADHPRYIETLSRRGYRFIAPLNGTDAQSADRVRITSPSAAQAQAAFSGRGLWQKAVVALLAVAIVGWGWRHWRKQAPTPAGPVIRSLAVLPLQNLSGDPSQEYFADGMTEELIGRLSKIHGLRVISRTSVMHFKTEASLASTHPVDPEAHEDYLKGRYYFNQRTEDALNRSIVYFQQALARDPNYALAYCGLADAYTMLGFRGGFPSKDALLRAKAAALKAIELDDTLAEPHASLAFIAETHGWDWATAEREYKRALELNPGDARAHHWYGGYLMYVGRFEEGIAEAKRARDLDPLSLPVKNALAGRLLVAGRVDEALDQLHETLEMDAHFPPAHQTLGWAYLNKGKHQDAIQEFQQALQLSGGDDTNLMLDLGFAYAAAGNREEARKILAKLKTLHERGLVPSGSIAILYGALGELNEAFAWLEKAYEERDPELTYLKVPGRRFDPLRHDPRFQQLVHRVGIPE